MGTDWGEGTLTKSGYPRQTKLWIRGQQLSEATLVFEGQESDVGVWPARLYHDTSDEGAHTQVNLIIRATTFYTNEVIWVDRGAPQRLALPDDIEVKGLIDGELLVALRKEWRIRDTKYPSGSLLSIPFNRLVQGDLGSMSTIWAPTARSSLEQVAITKNTLYFSVLEDVKTKIHKWGLRRRADRTNRWQKEVLNLPGAGTARIASAYPSEDVAFVNFESFTTPDQLLVLKTMMKSAVQQQFYDVLPPYPRGSC